MLRPPLRAFPGSRTIDLATLLIPAQSASRDFSVLETVAVLVILVLSLALHEVAHAWVAWKRGDSTAKDLGRITLDPLPHIDLWWTILLPAMLWFGSSGQFVFGGAKPVPVVFHNLRRPHRDMALVALAGPLSNIAIALLLALVTKVLVFELGIWSRADLGYQILAAGVQLNLFLAIFNLLPIPPLDGSRVMSWLLPEGLREPYQRLESIGILLVLLFLWGMPGVSQPLLVGALDQMLTFVDFVVTLGGLW